MPTSKDKTIRVGLLVAASLVVMMIFLFFIGSEQKIFSRKNEYKVQFDSVAGLADGNPVKISGVTVGVVKDIVLPRDPRQKDVRILLMVDRKYAERIRTDSRARLKKLGLLAGDSYIDITPGSPRFDVVEPGNSIPAQRQTNYDQLISSGEDLVDNLVQISYSLRNVLNRVDKGEGLLGELTSSPETHQRLTDTLMTTLNKTNAALAHMESGRGVMGKLIYDDKYADQLTTSLNSTVQSLQVVVASIQRSLESGNGMLPALLNDPEGKKKVYTLVDNLNTTSQNLVTFSSALQNGQGLVPRLLNDKPYGDQALSEINGLLLQLNTAVGKINQGNGTAGKLINDPSVYESINDILIGINESKMLRWLIRNRQQKGIEKRYDTEQGPKAGGKSNSGDGVPPSSGQPPSMMRVDPGIPAPAPSLPDPATTTGAPVTETAPPETTSTTPVTPDVQTPPAPPTDTQPPEPPH